MLTYEIVAFVILIALFVVYICKKYHSNAMDKRELESIVYTHSREGIFISDENGIILSVNPAFEKLTGYMASEIVNRNETDINIEIRSREFYTLFQQSISSKQPWEGEISDCHKDGSIFYKWLSIKSIMYHHEKYRYIATFLDMSKIEEANQKLWYQANFDTLTDLPNRNMFFEHLQKHIDKATRYGQQMALIYVDLSNFEEINDTYGHIFGDTVLQQAAARIANSIQENNLLYRIGGVEFAIIVPNVNAIEDTSKIATKIIKEMSSIFTFDGSKNFYICTNIGISIAPDNGLTGDVLFQHADNAMYASKKEGKNSFSHCKLRS